MAIRLAKLHDAAKKFFTKTYPNIHFEFELKNGEADLFKMSCNLQMEGIEDILVNIHVNEYGSINLEAVFGEIDKEDPNVLEALNEYNSLEPIGKVYADDFLNFCLGTTGVEEEDAIKTMNNMLDYFAASLEEQAFLDLVSLTEQ